MEGRRIGSLHTGNIYLDWLGESLLPKDGMALGGDCGQLGNINMDSGLGYGCCVVCHFGLIVLLLPPDLPVLF